MTLILPTLAAVLLTACAAYAQDRQPRQQQAIAAIRKLGGDVVVHATKPGAPVAVVLTASGNATACLPHLKDLGNLRTCDL